MFFLFGVSVLMLEYYFYGVSDKIIATMNTMIKAIKYNVNIAIVDKLFFMWITYLIELICILSIILCL